MFPRPSSIVNGGYGVDAKGRDKFGIQMPDDYADVRPIIVAEHASARFGGEAILPLHYFRFLRRRGVQAWLVVHERTRDELQALLGTDIDRVHFIRDTPWHKACFRASQKLPHKVAEISLGFALHGLTQVMQRKIVKDLTGRVGATVVHEPIPVSPKAPSMMYGMGVPVVIGPMNGGMNFPPGFPSFQSRSDGLAVKVARQAASAINRILPGKRQAATLLVANQRTRDALPSGLCSHVVQLVENGVDLDLFERAPDRGPPRSVPAFAFVGRLVQWKAVDLLLNALAAAVAITPMTLVVLGDGPDRARLESLCGSLGLSEHVKFAGFLPQRDCSARLDSCDALVLPSLYECGGAVVLEAMAKSLPVLATRWGGPADYLDDSTGILIDPTNPGEFTQALTKGLVRLARDPSLRLTLGQAARRRVQERYDWQGKIDQIIGIYREAQARTRA